MLAGTQQVSSHRSMPVQARCMCKRTVPRGYLALKDGKERARMAKDRGRLRVGDG